MKTAGLSALMLVLGLASCKESHETAPATAAQAPAVPVKVAPVVQRDVPVMIENIGQTRGSTEVEIRARIEGYIDALRFEEGKPVKKGDILYEIDPKPFIAALNRAKGLMASSQAELIKAKQDVARYKPLVEQNAISREEYETAVALEQVAVARVEATKANVESAELDLTYTKVLAPIDALVGKTEVKAGALVGRGQSTLLTTLSTNDPINCRFAVSERDYLAIARRAKEARESKDAEKHALEFEMVLSDGTVHTEKGKFVFIDRLVDSTTGTILVEVTFPNPGQILKPGQFARVRVAVAVQKGALLVPQRAVSELQATYSVGVVGSDNRVEMRAIKVGSRQGGLWIVDSGLRPGEQVIVEGVQKVRNGSTVIPTAVQLNDNGTEVVPKPEGGKAPQGEGK